MFNFYAHFFQLFLIYHRHEHVFQLSEWLIEMRFFLKTTLRDVNDSTRIRGIELNSSTFCKALYASFIGSELAFSTKDSDAAAKSKYGGKLFTTTDFLDPIITII